MKQEVILINRALAYNVVGQLRGLSGLQYATSIYEEAHGAHVARMSVEDYETAAKDIALGMIRRWSQWEVHFVPAEETREEALARIVVDLAVLEAQAPQDASPFVQAAFADAAKNSAPKQEEKEEPAPFSFTPHTAESLADKKYFALVKIGKLLGIDADKIDGSEALRAAILEKQPA